MRVLFSYFGFRVADLCVRSGLGGALISFSLGRDQLCRIIAVCTDQVGATPAARFGRVAKGAFEVHAFAGALIAGDSEASVRLLAVVFGEVWIFHIVESLYVLIGTGPYWLFRVPEGPGEGLRVVPDLCEPPVTS